MSEEMSVGLNLLVVGMGAVFSALAVTALMVVLVSYLTREKPVPVKPSVDLPEEDLVGRIDRHKIILLAAAASVAVKRPVRIRRVRFVSHKKIPSSWSAAGRSDHRDPTHH
jgi:Na+-transporting methylmalonyl-CoA/oxaloacetate decarboxylase gamma subunit